MTPHEQQAQEFRKNWPITTDMLIKKVFKGETRDFGQALLAELDWLEKNPPKIIDDQDRHARIIHLPTWHSALAAVKALLEEK